MGPAGGYARQALVLRHLIGIGVILVNGLALLHLGMPGQHYLLTYQPDTSVLFEFPLVMTLTFSVPMLVTVNLWMVIYLNRVPRPGCCRTSASRCRTGCIHASSR